MPPAQCLTHPLQPSDADIHSNRGHQCFKSSPSGENGRHFADDIFRCIVVNEKCCILSEISLKFVSEVPIDNDPAMV